MNTYTDISTLGIQECRTHQNKDLCLSADVGICPKDVMSIEMNIATCNSKYVAVFVITIRLIHHVNFILQMNYRHGT